MSNRLIIKTGICKCGHSWKDHHLGMIINAKIWNEIKAIEPDYPPYVPQECEHFGFNEYGGLDRDGNRHCFSYKDDPMPCKAGCKFKYGVALDCKKTDECYFKNGDLK